MMLIHLSPRVLYNVLKKSHKEERGFGVDPIHLQQKVKTGPSMEAGLKLEVRSLDALQPTVVVCAHLEDGEGAAYCLRTQPSGDQGGVLREACHR